MVIQEIVNWYKSIGMFGWFRFRTLWFAHRFIRNSGLAEQWDFVLKYLPYQENYKTILDVGTNGSLFIYELYHRGFITAGLDLKPYQEGLPYGIKVFIQSILNTNIETHHYDYITMISVLQFLGKDDKKAISEIYRILEPNGIFLLTVPSNTYTYLQIKELTKEYFEILEYQPCRGHFGMAFIRR